MALSAVLAGVPLAAQSTPPRSAGERSPFALRILDSGGPPGSEDVRRHVEFGVAAGFNAVWVASRHAGRWTTADAPRGPVLDAQFLELAAWCRARGVQLFLGLRPQHDSRNGYVFTNTKSAKRLARFMRLAHTRAGVRQFVLSFDEAPPRLSDLDDLLAYGRLPAAAAHVDLARRLQRRLGRGDRLWFAAAIASDAELEAPGVRYAAELMRELPRLPPGVGVVWKGPRPVSPTITADGLGRLRERLIGDRPLLLDDRYPANGSGERMPLALVLGPLRQREAGIAERISAYLCRPMGELGGSRLALLTVADFLRDPTHYDPDASWRAAMRRLAGERPDVLDALHTQAVEWGGWIDGLNYHTALTDNPFTAARSLRDPAAVAAWGWVVKTYSGRMGLLSGVEDEPFRVDLLRTMARRLAVARAVPLVAELLARHTAGDGETASLVRQLNEQRAELEPQPEVLQALDRFLFHVGFGRPPRSPASHDGPETVPAGGAAGNPTPKR